MLSVTASTSVLFSFLMIRRPPRSTLFPTRRSSDLRSRVREMIAFLAAVTRPDGLMPQVGDADDGRLHIFEGDRKSTRLNSSHTVISYAVFCLKKKKDEPLDVTLKQLTALKRTLVVD